jgi:hypothetical protein
LYHCDAIEACKINTIDPHERRELCDAEKRFVQALHFSRHVRSNHQCRTTYRDACYFGVAVAWCDDRGFDTAEMDGSNVLSGLRHLFATAPYANMNDDVLWYLRDLFTTSDDSMWNDNDVSDNDTECDSTTLTCKPTWGSCELV